MSRAKVTIYIGDCLLARYPKLWDLEQSGFVLYEGAKPYRRVSDASKEILRKTNVPRLPEDTMAITWSCFFEKDLSCDDESSIIFVMKQLRHIVNNFSEDDKKNIKTNIDVSY